MFKSKGYWWFISGFRASRFFDKPILWSFQPTASTVFYCFFRPKSGEIPFFCWTNADSALKYQQGPPRVFFLVYKPVNYGSIYHKAYKNWSLPGAPPWTQVLFPPRQKDWLNPMPTPMSLWAPLAGHPLPSPACMQKTQAWGGDGTCRSGKVSWKSGLNPPKMPMSSSISMNFHSKHHDIMIKCPLLSGLKLQKKTHFPQPGRPGLAAAWKLVLRSVRASGRATTKQEKNLEKKNNNRDNGSLTGLT